MSSEQLGSSNSGYISKHWSGDLSLGVSFWINVIAINLLIKVAVFGIDLIIPARLSTFTSLVFVPFVIWAVVGAWRSAEKQIVNSDRAFWPNVTKVFIVIWTFLFVITTAKEIIIQEPIEQPARTVK
jgi:hypothetical protein